MNAQKYAVKLVTNGQFLVLDTKADLGYNEK